MKPKDQAQEGSEFVEEIMSSVDFYYYYYFPPDEGFARKTSLVAWEMKSKKEIKKKKKGVGSVILYRLLSVLGAYLTRQ